MDSLRISIFVLAGLIIICLTIAVAALMTAIALIRRLDEVKTDIEVLQLWTEVVDDYMMKTNKSEGVDNNDQA